MFPAIRHTSDFVIVKPSRQHPTHYMIFDGRGWSHRTHHRGGDPSAYFLGSITYKGTCKELMARLGRVYQKLAACGIEYTISPHQLGLPKTKHMEVLERFSYKMSKIHAEYQRRLKPIQVAKEKGDLFTDLLFEQLEKQLEATIQKAEETYGYKREDWLYKDNWIATPPSVMDQYQIRG